MADLTADFNYAEHHRGNQPRLLTNTLVVFKGSLLALDDSTGYVVLHSDTAGDLFLGICVGGATGNTTTGVEATIDETGATIKRINVTGVSAITHVGDLVYCATDNPADFKVAANTNVRACGKITRWYSAAVCDVRLFTPEEHHNLASL